MEVWNLGQSAQGGKTRGLSKQSRMTAEDGNICSGNHNTHDTLGQDVRGGRSEFISWMCRSQSSSRLALV
jgi:hypothetical protein